MLLTPGTRLGPYEIQSAIGAGGMGEVYKARDTRLDRTVAIKILPETLATDTQFRQRFEREARAISQLDHPHICALHDIGEQDGTAYLVMQYLDGKTLDEHLAGGALALDEALSIAIDLADALTKAHTAGIVHRDLKPSNIKITKTGAKLLDFGLAKTSAPLLTGGAATMAATTPAVITQQGSILGTLQYMAPEQLEGREADARSDIFAFGAVLYEMVTATKAFAAASQASLVGAILKDTPKSISSLLPLASPQLERVVMTCLQKDPEDRWQTVRDLRRELEWLTKSPTAENAGGPSLHHRTRAVPWAVAVAAVAAALVAVGWSASRPTAVAPQTRLAAGLPSTAAYSGVPSPGRSLAISPDGRMLVYASGTQGRRQLYKRALDRLSIEPLAGTEGAFQPFFSPDGQWVAFFTLAGELKKIAINGGPPVTLAKEMLNGLWGFGVWRDDNVIVFSMFENLLQVSADGGTPTALTMVADDGESGVWHHFPTLVRSTGDIIFTVNLPKASAPRLDILRWDTKQRSTLVENASGAILTSSGHLLFTRDGVLMASVFDVTSRRIGTATPLQESVVIDRFGVSQLAIAGEGTLAYVAPDPDAPVPVLGWVSRSGSFSEIGQLPAGTDNAMLSPDATLALISVFGTSKVSIFDLGRRVSTPWTIGSRQVESSAWHPDGRRLTLGGSYLSLYDPNTGVESRLTPSGRPKRFASWTPDGRSVVYMTFEPSNDIYIVTLNNDGSVAAAPRPLFATSAPEYSPAISPDGHWIAYSSRSDQATGRTDVYIARFPDGSGRVQVTSAGGGAPFWSRKGDELFFPAPPGVLQSVPIVLGDRLQVGMPRTLFTLGDLGSFSVSPDGRFLAIKEPQTNPPAQIVIVQNWLDELKRVVPAP